MAPSNRTCMLASFLATIQLFTRSRYTCLDAHLSPALLDTCVLHNWVRLFLMFDSCFYSTMFSWDIIFKTFIQPNSAKREEKCSEKRSAWKWKNNWEIILTHCAFLVLSMHFFISEYSLICAHNFVFWYIQYDVKNVVFAYLHRNQN